MISLSTLDQTQLSLEFTGIDNGHSGWRSARVGSNTLDLLDQFLTFQNLAENDMSAIQPRSLKSKLVKIWTQIEWGVPQ